MFQNCNLNKDRDLGYTIPDLHIDITEAVETGIIRNTQVAIDTYNMMQETDEVGTVVRDTFTALDASREIDKVVNSTE